MQLEHEKCLEIMFHRDAQNEPNLIYSHQTEHRNTISSTKLVDPHIWICVKTNLIIRIWMKFYLKTSSLIPFQNFCVSKSNNNPLSVLITKQGCVLMQKNFNAKKLGQKDLLKKIIASLLPIALLHFCNTKEMMKEI